MRRSWASVLPFGSNSREEVGAGGCRCEHAANRTLKETGKKAKIGHFGGLGWTPKRPEQDSGGPTHQYRSLAVQRCRQHALARSEVAGVELRTGHKSPLLSAAIVSRLAATRRALRARACHGSNEELRRDQMPCYDGHEHCRTINTHENCQ